MTPIRSNPDLSPWPVRLIVYILLVILALLAIRVIDRHVMQKASPPVQSLR